MNEISTVYLPKKPWGFETLSIPMGDVAPDGATLIPPVSVDYKYIHPVFNSDTQIWEEYSETDKLQKLTMQQASQITSLKKLVMLHASDIAVLKTAVANPTETKAGA